MSTVITFDTFGGPEVLQVSETEIPEPGPGQLVVANRVVGINPADAKMLAGLFGPQRFPATPGFEAAGTVHAVGPDVTGFSVGDEVLWHGSGAQREHALVQAAHALVLPESVSHEQGAVLPVAAATAFSALAQIDLRPEQTVLIHGASGGVGTAAVQIALALGARVVGTASPRNHDYLRELGAEPVTYGDGLVDAVRNLGGVDAVVDLAGTPDAVAATVELLDDLQRSVTTVGGPKADAAGIPMKVDAKGALAEVLALAESGRLRTEIEARYPLTDAAEALRAVMDGHVRGKVVLTV
ncbi:NADP-dependent oxidoreductase [Paraoerskovia marina]|uniref:NADP-dependent oxidoreductase n=1 Tax=Paraoerskovia marina TaxID=545619 RepID=UPI0004927973|nr:NADP-dependent oxidoreductase [Paraoerskovia marina]